MRLLKVWQARVVLMVVSAVAVAAVDAAPFPGPDGFGHTATNIPFNLRDISETGTDLEMDDDDVEFVEIGFGFSFYGVEYTEAEVSSNGFVSFTLEDEAGCCSGEAIPTPGGTIDNFIAGFWKTLTRAAAAPSASRRWVRPVRGSSSSGSTRCPMWIAPTSRSTRSRSSCMRDLMTSSWSLPNSSGKMSTTRWSGLRISTGPMGFKLSS